MKTTLKLLPGLYILLLLGGCGGETKMEPVPVGEMVTYKDPAWGFQIQHPKGWIAKRDPPVRVEYSCPSA